MFRLIILSALVATSLAAGLRPRVPMLDGRIVGGNPTEIDKHCHQLSLMYRGIHICGASAISLNYALTAAHCTDGSLATALSVRAGTSFKGSGGEEVAVSDIIQHLLYNSRSVDYDIAILRLASPFTLAKPVSLVTQELEAGTSVIVSGWGALSEGGSSPSQLQEVYLKMISRAECKDMYGQSAITDRMVCAYDKGKDSCQGDSGGPMVTAEGVTTQAGVVSWGRGCARPNYAGVYTNVAYLHKWIESHTDI